MTTQILSLLLEALEGGGSYILYYSPREGGEPERYRFQAASTPSKGEWVRDSGGWDTEWHPIPWESLPEEVLRKAISELLELLVKELQELRRELSILSKEAAKLSRLRKVFREILE